MVYVFIYDAHSVLNWCEQISWIIVIHNLLRTCDEFFMTMTIAIHNYIYLFIIEEIAID